MPEILSHPRQVLDLIWPSDDFDYHWPGNSKWEIILGAFLVQNTTWTNTEKALTRLQAETSLQPKQILSLNQEELIALIFSAGFHQSKSILILKFFTWLHSYDFDLKKIQAAYPDTQALRNKLLSFKGIGEETADVLLLYIFDRPVFIADNYARKLFLGLKFQPAAKYRLLKEAIEAAGKDLSLIDYQKFHAAIIAFGKINLRGPGPHNHPFFDRYCYKTIVSRR